MPTSAVESPVRAYSSFGHLLKYLRRRAHLTQTHLAGAVGYSPSQISRIESGQRPPDLATLAARFVPSLDIGGQTDTVVHFLRLAAAARREPAPNWINDAHKPPSNGAGQSGQAPDNLPLPLTSFLGREQETVEIHHLLRTSHLVTLTGAGGVGKTRLSLRVARAAAPDFSDGVSLVELAPLSVSALVVQQVTTSLGLHDEPNRPILDTLTRYLRGRRVLLVLDNCEHLLETCAALANSLLRACPALCILASSREPLGVDGEVVYQVPSLPFSNAALLPPLAELGEFTSIRLFVDRARQVRPDYSLNEHNAAAVARICQRLDGIPLAIELAAARVRMLPARQIAARLDDRFDLLTGGSRTALPKHQTLRASIDWSYDLLTETEKTLLRRLAVFAGGWRLEAAEAIASGDGLAIARVLDLISHLVDKSLVQVDRSGAGADWRYHLLETVRQYALQRTDSAGERQELSRRHRDYFLALAEGRDQLASAREIHAWDQQMAADVDNLRLALEWSFEHLTPLEAGPRLTMLAGRVWPTTGEELAWAIRAVELCQHRTDLPAPIRADVISWGSGLMTAHHAPTSVAWSEQAVEISRSLGPAEQKRLVSHLHRLVYRHLYASRDIEKARAAFVEAEGILTARGRELWTAEEIQGWKPVFSAIKAEIANGLGDLKEAKRHAADSLRLFDTLDDLYASVDSRTLLADICTQLREYEEARTHFLVALRQSDEMLLGQAKPTSKAFLLRSLAHLEVRAGNLDAALCHCQAALREALSIPEHNIIASCLGTAAIIQARLENAAEAAMLAGASLTAYTSQGHKPWEDSSLDTLLPGWANGPDRAPIEAAFMAGQNQSAEEAAATLLQAVDEASLGRGPQALY